MHIHKMFTLKHLKSLQHVSILRSSSGNYTDTLPQHQVHIRKLITECLYECDFSKEQCSSLKMILGSNYVRGDFKCSNVKKNYVCALVGMLMKWISITISLVLQVIIWPVWYSIPIILTALSTFCICVHFFCRVSNFKAGFLSRSCQYPLVICHERRKAWPD